MNQFIPHAHPSVPHARRVVGYGQQTRRRIPRVAYLPLIVFQVYLTLTLAIFTFGPVPYYHNINFFMLYSYVLAGQFAIFFGYCYGLRKPPSGYRGFFSASQLLTLSILLSLAMVAPELLYRRSSGVSLAQAIVNPADAYNQKLLAEGDHLGFTIIAVLMAPLSASLLPWGVMNWYQTGAFRRTAWLLACAGNYILPGLLLGTNKFIFDFVLPLPWLIALAIYDGDLRVASRRLRISRATRTVFLPLMSIVLVAAAVFYFSYSASSREVKYRVVNSERNGWSQAYGVRLPDSVESAIFSICKYSAQGYDGLAGCLELPFVWCYGYGNSYFLTRQAQRLVPDASIATRDKNGFAVDSYPVRLENVSDYPTSMLWHTIYPWIASDLTFPGALVFIGLMGFYFAQAWTDALRGENPFAFSMVALFCIMFVYIPANNVLLGGADSLSAFVVTFFAWRTTRCA